MKLYLSSKRTQLRHLKVALHHLPRMIQSHCPSHALAFDKTSRTPPLNHLLYSSDLQEERGNEGG